MNLKKTTFVHSLHCEKMPDGSVQNYCNYLSLHNLVIHQAHGMLSQTWFSLSRYIKTKSQTKEQWSDGYLRLGRRFSPTSASDGMSRTDFTLNPDLENQI